jgi:hypothetical protein
MSEVRRRLPGPRQAPGAALDGAQRDGGLAVVDGGAVLARLRQERPELAGELLGGRAAGECS